MVAREGENVRATTSDHPHHPDRRMRTAKRRWTVDAIFMAKSLSQRPCTPTSSLAVCWCPIGAICRVAKRDESGRFDATCNLNTAVGRPIADFNDDPATTHAMVLAAFDRAIEKASVKEITT